MNKALLSASICLSLCAVRVDASAQQAPAPVDERAEDTATATEETTRLSTVSVTGLRGVSRSATDSAVPIEAISQEEIESVPSTDTLDVLRTLLPSFSVSRASNSTTGSFIRAVSMRGLGGDKTLLLVNGKRRHKSASVSMAGSGSQAADAAIIPAVAIKRLEVLRDGAAAQYGSDAIAGVINFELKDADQGGTLTAQAGQYYEGDGEDYLIAGNIGLPLTRSGFVNISAELTKNARAVRSDQFVSPAFDALAYAEENPQYAAAVDLSRPLQRIGKPKSEAHRLFINSGIDVGDYGQLYSFMNYSWSEGWTDANYRYPGHGQPVNDTPVRLADGSAWTFTELFPGGFTPQFAGRIKDASAVFGYRDSLSFSDSGMGSELNYDLSGRYGRNRIDYLMQNTVNPSLGATSPRDFHSYGFVSEELSLNADAAYLVPLDWMYDLLTVNGGLELRRENFEIVPGDPWSYAQGPYAFADPYGFCTDDFTLSPGAPTGQGINCGNHLPGTEDGFPGIDPVYNTLPVGASGFPGIAPVYAGRYHNTSYSAYAEVSGDVTERLFLDFAGRYEHYDDFGANFNYKGAARYRVNDVFSLRGSVGSGFRAPTAGLLNIQSISVVSVDAVMQETGLFPPSGPIASYLGATALEPEESTNASLGFTLSPSPNASLTVDAYRIDIDDMIYATSLIQVTDDIRQQMVDAGIAGASTVSSVRFFQNAFDAKVTGVDLIGTYRKGWANGQTTDFAASVNFNDYKIDRVHIDGLFNEVSVYNFENGSPRFRGMLSANHDFGRVSALARANIYGPYDYMRTTAPNPVQEYGTEVMFDVELQYRARDNLRLAVGASNLFDNYPDRDQIDSVSYGQRYRDGVVDWMGGFYYARLSLDF